MIGADPIAAYIGMTRCRTRSKILIYRPFPLAPFQEGLPLGRQLLLDVWKQEPVDWDALRKKYLDERPCQECGEMKRKDAFTKAQWKQEAYRVCKECTAQKREAGTPYRCTQCGLWHAAAHFASKHQNPRWSMYRVCLSRDTKKNVLFATRTKQRIFSAPPHGTRENLNEDCAYVAKLKLTARGSARPVANESRGNNFRSLSPDGHQERMARKHAIHAVLPWCRIQSASVLPRPPLRD
jgi:hypothetical protein